MRTHIHPAVRLWALAACLLLIAPFIPFINNTAVFLPALGILAVVAMTLLNIIMVDGSREDDDGTDA